MIGRSAIKVATAAILGLGYASVLGQSLVFERLPAALLDVTPPSSRVEGAPGEMRIVSNECRALPAGNLRQRIVNTAVQEWAYFGFSVYDQTHLRGVNTSRRWTRPRIDPAEAERVAASIAGYWSAAPNSSWIVQDQNNRWERSGPATRWRNPWSAAFVSWVMCEAGLGDSARFQRAIAHHTYIDQAIAARDQQDSGAAYQAFEVGEQVVQPGDMLCRGYRPFYSSIAQRKTQMGEGARTHCDIVVKVDEKNEQFLMIGGNVRGWVRLKVLPGSAPDGGNFQPVPYGGRQIFAHLKLQEAETMNTTLEQTAVMQRLDCSAQKGLVSTLALQVEHCS